MSGRVMRFIAVPLAAAGISLAGGVGGGNFLPPTTGLAAPGGEQPEIEAPKNDRVPTDEEAQQVCINSLLRTAREGNWPPEQTRRALADICYYDPPPVPDSGGEGSLPADPRRDV